MASSVEEVSYELGGLTGVAVLGSVLTAVYTGTVDLPPGAPGGAADSLDEAHAAAEQPPAGQADSLLDAATSAFDNGYTTLVIATALLAFGALFAYRYLGGKTGTPSTATEQAEPAMDLALTGGVSSRRGHR